MLRYEDCVTGIYYRSGKRTRPDFRKIPNAIEGQEVRTMDVNTYCDSLAIELTGWKAKVYDIVRKLDKMSSGDKAKVVPEVNELHMIIEELDDRIERLKKECPVEWEPERIELERKTSQLKTTWGNVANKIS
jgi:predicted nuclease with TOPRIM domain